MGFLSPPDALAFSQNFIESLNILGWVKTAIGFLNWKVFDSSHPDNQRPPIINMLLVVFFLSYSMLLRQKKEKKKDLVSSICCSTLPQRTYG